MNNIKGEKILLSLSSLAGNPDISYLINHDSIVNKNLKFISGTIIKLSEKCNCFVVLSYETTKKTRFILTGVSIDGKNKLWELKQSSLRPNFDNENPLCWNYDKELDVIFLGMKDEVIAMDISSGAVLWKQRL